MDRDGRPKTRYGFVRGAQTGQARLTGPDRLFRPEVTGAAAASAVFARQEPPEGMSARPAPKADNHGWVVRPKMPEPVAVSAPRTRLRPGNRRSTASVTHGLPAFTPQDDGNSRPRRWLVAGLVGMVYLVGIAGLWSMMQTFDDGGPATFTPAGDEDSLPPLDDSIEVRDAHLDDPFVPAFRPDPVYGIGRTIAASNLEMNQI